MIFLQYTLKLTTKTTKYFHTFDNVLEWKLVYILIKRQLMQISNKKDFPHYEQTAHWFKICFFWSHYSLIWQQKTPAVTHHNLSQFKKRAMKEEIRYKLSNIHNITYSSRTFKRFSMRPYMWRVRRKINIKLKTFN